MDTIGEEESIPIKEAPPLQEYVVCKNLFGEIKVLGVFFNEGFHCTQDLCL